MRRRVVVLVGEELEAWSEEESCGSCWGGVGSMDEKEWYGFLVSSH